MPIQTPICDFGKKALPFELKSTENEIISLDNILLINILSDIFLSSIFFFIKTPYKFTYIILLIILLAMLFNSVFFKLLFGLIYPTL